MNQYLKKIAVYTMTRERLPYTQRTFDRLYETAGVEFDHFVFDNGSQDGTQAWLKEQTHLKKLILSPDNKGLWNGINILLKESSHFEDYDYVLKLDNDVEFPHDKWLARLLEIMEENKPQKLVLSPYVDGLGRGTGGAPRIRHETLYNENYAETFGIANHVGGICLFTDRAAYDVVMPNGRKSQGWDVWFCSYARSMGYKVGYIEGLQIKHMDGSVKQVEDDPAYQARKESEAKQTYDGDNSDYHVQF